MNNNCFCMQNTFGPFCEFKTCEKNCSNLGKCDKNGKCVCNPGFKGDFCETETCKHECSNHGNCFYTDNVPMCKCDIGFHGE